MYKIIISVLIFILAITVNAGENKNLTNLTDDNFKKEVLESEKIVLVDFWAPWCGPCKKLGPIIEELANEKNENIKFTKLNVDENKKMAGAYGIRSIPTVAVFKDGKPIDGFVGLRSKADIETMLKKHINSATKIKTTKKTMPGKK